MQARFQQHVVRPAAPSGKQETKRWKKTCAFLALLVIPAVCIAYIAL